MKKTFLLLCSAFALATAFAQLGQNATGEGLLVKTANGSLQGVREKSGIRSFKGIPYAAPPVGDLRWREPQPAKPWTGVLKADHFGPRAMQTAIYSDMVFRSDGVSENCLYLNVWAPQSSGGKRLPVLVYFYGGGYIAGDGSEPRYDGESMARQGIVAITVNYRLGVFGFLSHPELTKESPHHASGNYGLLDQAASLQWVRNNIAAFGGDPNKITIAGESAGSVSVSAQMATPLARNLIAGAIGESGSIMGTLPPVSQAEAEQNGVQFAKAASAASLAELRALSADSVLSAASRFGLGRFPRTLDGYFFPKNPTEIFANGEQAHVPLLVGWNSEEGNWRSIVGNTEPTKEAYIAGVRKMYGNKADEVLAVYSVASDNEVEEVGTALASDRFIGFSTWRWANLHGKTSGKNVYRYFYERPRPAMVNATNNSTPKGAVHSAEIEYAMGNLATNKAFAWAEDDYKVSRQMQAYFANFIKTGDPNGGSLLNWPAANRAAGTPVMHINVQSRVEPEKNPGRYQFMEAGSR